MENKVRKKLDRPYMDHYLIECFDAPESVTNNQQKLASASNVFCKKLGVHVVNSFSHKFNPYGITLVLVLSESHFAVHTWPEKKYLVIDVLSCQKISTIGKIRKITEEVFPNSKVVVKKLNSNNE